MYLHLDVSDIICWIRAGLTISISYHFIPLDGFTNRIWFTHICIFGSDTVLPLFDNILALLIGPSGKKFSVIWIKIQHFSHKYMCMWNCRLRNDNHVVLTSLCYKRRLEMDAQYRFYNFNIVNFKLVWWLWYIVSTAAEKHCRHTHAMFIKNIVHEHIQCSKWYSASRNILRPYLTVAIV